MVSSRVEHNILHEDTCTVVVELVKEVGEWTCLQIQDSIKPVLISIQGMVKDGQIPVRVTGPDNMGETVPFCISLWAHVDIWEPIDNVDGKNISIKGGDALQSTLDFDGMVIDIVAICLQLG